MAKRASAIALVALWLTGGVSAGLWGSAGCAPGRFADADGSCVPCPPGTANPTGAAACVACKPGMYAAAAGASACRSCGAYASTAAAGATTCTCDQNKAPGYSTFRDKNGGLAECCNDNTCASSGGLARL